MIHKIKVIFKFRFQDHEQGYNGTYTPKNFCHPIEEYDPVGNKWKNVSCFPIGRVHTSTRLERAEKIICESEGGKEHAFSSLIFVYYFFCLPGPKYEHAHRDGLMMREN